MPTARDQILPAVPPGEPEASGSASGPRLQILRDDAVPRAICPGCGASMALTSVGVRWSAASPAAVADRFAIELATIEREELYALVLDTKCRVIHEARVYVGNVSAAIVRVGELFAEAVLRHGSGIIIVHNHPSGDLTPSPDDLRLTTSAIAAGRLLDVLVLDHVIVGAGRFVSLREQGLAFDQYRTSRP